MGFFGKKPKKTVVVHVEDEPDIRDLVQAALVPMGIEVLSAIDGKAGLELVIKEKPDLVLLDVRMPIMDGFAVCAELRERPEFIDTPIFIVTALSQVKDIERAVQIGATGYILKPIDIAKLRHKVIEILGGNKKA
jgi:DNA-binding response OmpR family regulator